MAPAEESCEPWVGLSLGTLTLGELLYSVLFFWPRNEILFEEGAAVHSAEVLRQTALEFELGHWGRLGMSAVTAALVFIGFLRLHRSRVLVTQENVSGKSTAGEAEEEEGDRSE